MKKQSTFFFILMFICLITIPIYHIQAMEINRLLTPVQPKYLHFMIDVGLGNITSLYCTYGDRQFNIGLGCGYIYYTDAETDGMINSISPSIIISTTVSGIIVLRQRCGFDFIGEKGHKLSRMGYIFSSDLLIKIYRLKESSFCGGASLPVLIGENSVDFDTVIGVSYIIDF